MIKALESVAEAEFLPPEFIRGEVAAGRVVIPGNRNRPSVRALGVGRALRTPRALRAFNGLMAGLLLLSLAPVLMD